MVRYLRPRFLFSFTSSKLAAFTSSVGLLVVLTRLMAGPFLSQRSSAAFEPESQTHGTITLTRAVAQACRLGSLHDTPGIAPRRVLGSDTDR